MDHGIQVSGVRPPKAEIFGAFQACSVMAGQGSIVTPGCSVDTRTMELHIYILIQSQYTLGLFGWCNNPLTKLDKIPEVFV
jgi:hypothetical protein